MDRVNRIFANKKGESLSMAFPFGVRRGGLFTTIYSDS